MIRDFRRRGASGLGVESKQQQEKGLDIVHTMSQFSEFVASEMVAVDHVDDASMYCSPSAEARSQATIPSRSPPSSGEFSRRLALENNEFNLNDEIGVYSIHKPVSNFCAQ
jgi:hypothetical protein